MTRSTVNAAFLLASTLIAASAHAHGPVIPLTLSGGSIAPHVLDLDGNDANGYTPAAVSRSFYIPLVYQGSTSYPNDNGWYGQVEATQPSNGEDTTFLGPGLAFGQGGFTATTVFRVSFTQAAQVWATDLSADGGLFVATGGETIQSIRGNFTASPFANTVTSNGATTGTGVVTGAVGTTAGAHSQIRWRLLGPTGSSVPSAANVIDDGLYLAGIQVSAYADATTLTPYATSSPYYMLFEQNGGGTVTAAARANAQNYIANTLVPEPASLAVLATGAVGLMARRRRR